MPSIEVAAGLIFREGSLLIAQRRSNAHLGGLWEFPGGKRESGESFETCLRRELREELDTVVEVGELIDSVEHTYPEKSVSLRFYRCQLTGPEPRAVDCQAIAWVTPRELADYEFPAADNHLLERLRSDPGLWTTASDSTK